MRLLVFMYKWFRICKVVCVCCCTAICLCYHLPVFLLVCVSVRRNLFANASFVFSLVYLSACFDGSAFKKINEVVSLRSAWVLECSYLYPCACASVFRVAVCACVSACLLTRMFIPYARMHVTVCNFCCVSAHRLGRLCVCILVWLSFSQQCVFMLGWFLLMCLRCCVFVWMRGCMFVCPCPFVSVCCVEWL